ncbi:MAG: TIGR03546 family protein [Planctomycetaceae bacterium]|nr:TIGR03546 family protein [Planctomycetaceae bacterium]
MFWLVLRPLRFFARAIVDQDSVRQLALGFALGMVVGLVPKGNLIAISLMMIVGASKVNLGTSMMGAFVFSWVGMLIDPISHEVGLWLLTQESLSGFWTWLYNQPIVPWTRFNNTVVLGSFVLGWALFYPVYRITKSRLTVWQPKLAERFQKFKLTQILLGAEYASKLGGA